MVDVFISYSRANRDVVRRLAEAIAALGYVVWWDEELPVHLSYGDVITDKIGEAKATLVVWSAESAASEWVRAEADMARNQKKLIQTSIDDCTPPLPFNQIQYAPIGDWTGEADHLGWRKAQVSLAALCGPPPAGEATLIVSEPAPPEPTLTLVPMPPAAASSPPLHVAPRPRPRSRTNRLALIAIGASLATILTVGTLVIVKGPPTAHAETRSQPAPTAPPPAAPAVTPAPAATPPKTIVVDAVVQPAEENEDPGENLPDVEDDF
jgi:hypothetical protein